jgi:hypothetical protein
MPIKDEKLDFSDMSGGKNSAFPRHGIQRNQVVDTLNALHEAVGVSRAPGVVGIATTALFDKPVRGWFTYKTSTGAELMIAVCDKKLYNVDVAAGTKAEIGAGMITADTECYAVNAAGKLWLVNGTDFVKVESDLAVYRVGIAAPYYLTPTTVQAGGSLATGLYTVYVSYARKSAGGQYLLSYPTNYGTPTLTPGNQTIRLTIPASTDAQVTHKVYWMTDAGGSVVYFYGEVPVATATVDIVDASTRNPLVLMSTTAASNWSLPIAPSGIFTFDDKLIVFRINESTLYWSLKTDINPFDLERFLPQNFRTVSHSINAVFSVGTNLHLNHLGIGISTIANGDMSSVVHLTDSDRWFLDCKTPNGKSNVVSYKSRVFGMTNDGFRSYNGGITGENVADSWSEDLSFHIKPDIDRVYAGISTTYLPAMAIHRRSGKRTELRFSFRNLDYGSGGNNDQLVFNLDFYFDQDAPKRTWERWENGWAMAALKGGTIYGAQSYAGGGQIVRDAGASDKYCYNRLGAFLSSEMFVKQVYILTRTVIDSLESITVWGQIYALATAGGVISANMIIFDVGNSKFPAEISGVAPTFAVLPPALSGGGIELPFVMAPQYPIGSTMPIPFDARGNSVAIELSQIADDESFFLYALQLPRAKKITNNLT